MSTHVLAMRQKNKRQAMGKLSDSYRTPPCLSRAANLPQDKSQRSQTMSISKRHLLGSLLYDNQTRAFTFNELRALLKCFTNEAVYRLILRLRRAGVGIKVKSGLVIYTGN